MWWGNLYFFLHISHCCIFLNKFFESFNKIMRQFCRFSNFLRLKIRPLLLYKVYVLITVAWGARIVGRGYICICHTQTGNGLILLDIIRQVEERVKRSYFWGDALNIWSLTLRFEIFFFFHIKSDNIFSEV